MNISGDESFTLNGNKLSFKAISNEIALNEDDILNKIEIINKEDGKPVANLEALKIKNIESMDLSLSHIKNYAIASFSILFK